MLNKQAKEFKKEDDVLAQKVRHAYVSVAGGHESTKDTEGFPITEPAKRIPTHYVRRHQPQEKATDYEKRIDTLRNLGIDFKPYLKYSEADYKALEKRIKLRQTLDFENWIATTFLKNVDPKKKGSIENAKAWVWKHYPKFYEPLLDSVDFRMKCLKKFGDLQVNGAETRDDLFLMYMLQELLKDDPQANHLWPYAFGKASKGTFDPFESRYEKLAHRISCTESEKLVRKHVKDLEGQVNESSEFIPELGEALLLASRPPAYNPRYRPEYGESGQPGVPTELPTFTLYPSIPEGGYSSRYLYPFIEGETQ